MTLSIASAKVHLVPERDAIGIRARNLYRIEHSPASAAAIVLWRACDLGRWGTALCFLLKMSINLICSSCPARGVADLYIYTRRSERQHASRTVRLGERDRLAALRWLTPGALREL